MLTIQPRINSISYRSNFVPQTVSNPSERPAFNEISKTASDAISNTQRGLINLNSIIPLDKTSEASIFFGIDSRNNINNQLLNQLALTVLKTKDQNIINFPNMYIYKMVDGEDINRLERPINRFKETGVARWTLRSGNELHTIGLVKDNDTVYVLDSLNSFYKDKEKFKDTFRNLFGENIVFSTKPQQKNDEYTCNNWTHANIDAVLQAIEDGRLTKTNLDDILPNNINKILEEQKDYVTDNFGGQSATELFKIKRFVTPIDQFITSIKAECLAIKLTSNRSTRYSIQ